MWRLCQCLWCTCTFCVICLCLNDLQTFVNGLRNLWKFKKISGLDSPLHVVYLNYNRLVSCKIRIVQYRTVTDFASFLHMILRVLHNLISACLSWNWDTIYRYRSTMYDRDQWHRWADLVYTHVGRCNLSLHDCRGPCILYTEL